MKKSVIFIIIAFILIPLNVFAVSDVNFDITKYNINADVQNNGDVNVCEYIKMDGSYNGYVRDIYYKIVILDVTNIELQIGDLEFCKECGNNFNKALGSDLDADQKIVKEFRFDI